MDRNENWEIGKEWINIHKKISSEDVVQIFVVFFSISSLCKSGYYPESENRLKLIHLFFAGLTKINYINRQEFV